ncbi:hypothetical protein KSX_69060 [Ktedonospora formicarum]|uniref:Transposase InsH N-terminal domain-containing protein n=1 Tax=Ktedonospora formicarum TaxID=2778364 RepID=A0A8J3I7V1_9CHLR|nr:hypothetical protein KSX_69060 [Ktedonospora formicarum]
MGDELSAVFCDDPFSSFFPRRGQPAKAPWRLAFVTVLQFVEGLSDRQAAEAVRTRIDWKYALRLELEGGATILKQTASFLLQARAVLVVDAQVKSIYLSDYSATKPAFHTFLNSHKPALWAVIDQRPQPQQTPAPIG